MGTQIPGDRQAVEGELGASDPILPISGGDPASDLHDQCGGVAAHESAQDHQDAGIVSERGSGDEAAIPGVAERDREVGHDPALAAGVELLSDAVGGAYPGGAQSLGTTWESIREIRMNVKGTVRLGGRKCLRQQGIWISPFPVCPSGAKPGRAGSPHAGARREASKKRWHAPCAGSPHKRGCRPLVHPLLRVARLATDGTMKAWKGKSSESFTQNT